MSVLPAIPESIVKEYNRLITNFIWNNGKSKVALSKLQNNKKNGGLKLVNLKLKDESLKASWVINVSEDNYLRAMAFRQLDPFMNEHIFRCNLHENDIKQSFPDSFWRDVLIAWSRYACHKVITANQAVSQVLWYNSHIKSDGKIFKSKKALRNGLLRIYDLLDVENQRFLTADGVADKYNITVMLANSLLSAIPKYWRSLISDNFSNVLPSELPYETFVLTKKPAATYYNTILEKENQAESMFPTYVKWQSTIHSSKSYTEFMKLFKNVYRITNHSKLRSFQYRLLHNALVTNKQLKTMVSDKIRSMYVLQRGN